MESTGLAEQERVLASDWGGGKSPFGTSWSKFMMWIFIISDALTFAGFLIAYGFMRQVAPAWPVQMEVFSPVLITFMTFVLISSSAVMAMAVSAARGRESEGRHEVPCANDFRRSDLPGLSGLRMVALHFRGRDPDAKSMGSPAVCGRVLRYYRVSTVSTCSAG